jgi:hypothetical protein
MALAIDDYPSLSVSRLRASGAISPTDATTTVAFADGSSFLVGLSHLRFPNGGGWSFFICPCGRKARALRLVNGAELACPGCLKARGLRYRVEDLSRSERAVHVASRLSARLNSSSPARLHPRPGRMLDRRLRLATALWRAEYAAVLPWLAGP